MDSEKKKKYTSSSSLLVQVVVQTTSAPAKERYKDFASPGRSIKRRFKSVTRFSGGISEKTIKTLASRSWVKNDPADLAVKGLSDIDRTAIGTDAAFTGSGYDGYGVTVTVLDYGINAIQDLKDPSTGASRVTVEPNFTTDTSTGDLNGHGTHIGGLIAGNGSKSTRSQYTRTFKGVAPRANLVSIKVLDANGQGTVSDHVAPGNTVVAAKVLGSELDNAQMDHDLPLSYYVNGGDLQTFDDYYRLSRTSQATWIVSGAVALLLH